eukprot:COSAG01_NODE_2771_length_7101_cov_12.982148_2_plen_112_part_00
MQAAAAREREKARLREARAASEVRVVCRSRRDDAKPGTQPNAQGGSSCQSPLPGALLGRGGTLTVRGCCRQSRSAEAAQAELARAAELRQQVSGGARGRGEIMGLIVTKTG